MSRKNLHFATCADLPKKTGNFAKVARENGQLRRSCPFLRGELGRPPEGYQVSQALDLNEDSSLEAKPPLKAARRFYPDAAARCTMRSRLDDEEILKS